MRSRNKKECKNVLFFLDHYRTSQCQLVELGLFGSKSGVITNENKYDCKEILKTIEKVTKDCMTKSKDKDWLDLMAKTSLNYGL